MSVFMRIKRREDIPVAIARYQQMGIDHRVVLLQALYRGQIGLIEPQRERCSGLFKRWAASLQLPGICLIGDDDDAPTGPEGWPMARRALRWANQVVVHGTGAELVHYQAAVAAAQITRRLLFIECGSATLDAWTEAAVRWAPTAAKLRLETRNGGVHPVPTAREAVH